MSGDEMMTLKQRVNQQLSRRSSDFRDDENGSIIIFTLFLLILMLAIGGMAVDFMRFECERAVLQSTADRAVLAAADLDQDADQKQVVIDYFEKAGLSGAIVGEPNVEDLGGRRSVGVVANQEINTIFLKLLGIHKLSSNAASTAVDGVADIEVSLVVDLSGSMAEPASGTSDTKIVALRKAAAKLAENMLQADYAGRISLSLVPYSEHVNVGPSLFGALKVDQKHNFSYCVDFDDSDFDLTGLNLSKTYTQMQHYQWNSDYNYDTGQYRNTMTNTVCPRYSYEQVTPLTQDLAALKTQINKLQPRAGTAIYMGLKWGLALLDPSLQPVVSTLISSGKIDAQFQGRPDAYPVAGETIVTQKVIVLMTDGANSGPQRLNSWAYDSPSDRVHWANNNLWWFYSRELYYTDPRSWFTYDRYLSDPTNLNTAKINGITNGDYLMQGLCQKAKDKGVIIYAIAVEAGSHGDQEMAKCASSTSHYFNVNGGELENVFSAIARQITDLRLAL